MCDLKSGAEMDAAVHQALTGAEVLGIVPCRPYEDGDDWSVTMRGDQNGAELRPVYIPERGCAPEYHTASHLMEGETLVLGHHLVCLEVVPEYSTDISAAWTLAERLRELVDGTVGVSIGNSGARAWVVRGGMSNPEIVAKADTAPLAICRVALMVVGEVKT